MLSVGRRRVGACPTPRLHVVRTLPTTTLLRPASRCNSALLRPMRSFSVQASRQEGTLFSPQVIAGVLLLALASAGALLYIRFEDIADERHVRAMPLQDGNPLVYLDITDGDERVGRIVIQLRADTVPKTAENFRVLCTGHLGWGYKLSPIHTVEKGRRVFAGDFFGGGNSGYSIYGDTFADEAFALSHVGPGTVGMRNTGPDSNASQFYITFRRMPELDGRSVVVGYVVDGFEVLAALDKAANTSGGRFSGGHDYRIGACGQLHSFQKGQGAEDAALRQLQEEVAKAQAVLPAKP